MTARYGRSAPLLFGALLIAIDLRAAATDGATTVAPARSGSPTAVDGPTAGQRRAEVIPPELESLQQLAPDGSGAPDGSSAVRYEALREVAHTLGVQAGVRYRYDALNALLDSNRQTLDRLFDFRPLMLHDGRVAPPVIDEAAGAYRIASDTEASQVQASYSIEQDARLVSRAPDWRDYLVQHYPAFERPDEVMLPKALDERRVWSAAVTAGWWEGVAQAERLFDIHRARLKRDYLGMARFKRLALHGMVDVPLLAESPLGVVVHGRRLNIGERIFRITSTTDFRAVRHWRPVIHYVAADGVQVTPPAPPPAEPAAGAGGPATVDGSTKARRAAAEGGR